MPASPAAPKASRDKPPEKPPEKPAEKTPDTAPDLHRWATGSGTIVAPLGDVHAGYCGRRIDILLTTEQATALALLRAGLMRTGARLRVGALVATPPDAVRWLIEQLTPAPGSNPAPGSGT